MRYVFTISVLFLITFKSSGQTDSNIFNNDTIPANYYNLHPVERDGITLPEVNIPEVVIIGRQNTSKKFSYRKYERLVYNLKKVYPYSLIVRARMAQVNEELKKIPNEKDRKRYLKKVEKDVFAEYEDDVRGMTITQGKLLIKLIDRETQNTSYTLIRQYRGNFSAAFWQSIARLFGTNLKAEYDPYGTDAVIEMILVEIEAGRL